MQQVDIKENPIGTLMWTAPLSREDGSPLNPNNIASYNIYCGSRPKDYRHDISVDGAILYYEFDFVDLFDLPLYVVITTVDLDGRESVFSEERAFVKKIYGPKPPTDLVIGLKVL